MGDHSIISAWSKTSSQTEPPSAFETFNAYCQDETREEYAETAPEMETNENGEISYSEVGSAMEHERLAKRRRAETEEPIIKDEEIEAPLDNDVRVENEAPIENDEYSIDALYLQGTVEDEPEPEPVKSSKRRRVSPLRDAPRIKRQANLSPIDRSTGQTVYHFGPIAGIEVGAHFVSREEARLANVHRASIKGIVGSQDVGCSSVCVNGGYEDNEDTGYTIVYSGDGGKSPTKDEPGADQTWSPANRALLKSFREHHAIRVLRGYKSKGKCAPAEGYRYDGLYQILRCWISRSVSFGHYKTIKFAMQRLPKQAPIKKDEKTLPEPAFVLNDLSGDWIVMPKHYRLVAQNDFDPPDPILINFDDEFGDMTPEDLAKMRRKEKKARRNAPNHSAVKRERRDDDANIDPSLIKEEGRSGRVFKSLEDGHSSQKSPDYFKAVNVIHDQFGNVMPTSTVVEQAPAVPVIQNVEFHKTVNKDVYQKMFPTADTKHPTRGYMRWRQRCFADQRIYDNLDEIEALEEQAKQV